MQNTTGKLMELIVARKLAQDLEGRKVLPQAKKDTEQENHLGKRSQIRIRCLRRIPEEGTNSGRGGRSRRCVQQSAIQTADGTPCAIWRQSDAHKMARSSTPATWKLDPHAPTADNRTSTRLPPPPPPCPKSSTMSTQKGWRI